VGKRSIVSQGRPPRPRWTISVPPPAEPAEPYGAFGTRELFIKSYRRYRETRERPWATSSATSCDSSAAGADHAVALDIYLSGDAGPRGCFTVMTAASEAVSDPDIRAMVLEGFTELDKAFTRAAVDALSWLGICSVSFILEISSTIDMLFRLSTWL
jgi:hypothetical protein